MGDLALVALGRVSTIGPHLTHLVPGRPSQIDATFVVGCIAAGAVLYVVYEQLSFMLAHKGKVPGPGLVQPVVGGLIEMVMVSRAS